MNTENIWMDVDEWEDQILSGQPITTETIDRYEELMLSYTGEYLQEFDYWWAERERQR